MPEHIYNAILLATLGGVLAGIAYCIKKIWNHDVALAEMRVRLAGLDANVQQQLTWQAEQVRMLARMDRTLVKIAEHLNVEIEGG